MEIGQKVMRVPLTFSDRHRPGGEPIHQPMSGTVIYIHPKGRYHTVEFKLKGGTVRECFQGVAE